jgi:hypothetical protein
MWIIVVFIMVLGAGSMTYRAATDPHRNKPTAPAAATTISEAVSPHQIDPAVRPSSGSDHGSG